jgi:hypothetical protein
MTDQRGSGMCSLCKSQGVTKRTCPLNPTSKNPSYEKHPLAKKKSITPSAHKAKKINLKPPSASSALSASCVRSASCSPRKSSLVNCSKYKAQQIPHELDELDEILYNSYQGLTESKGGLNIGDLTKIANRNGLEIYKGIKKAVILDFLSQKHMHEKNREVLKDMKKNIPKERKKMLNKHPRLKETYINFMNQYGLEYDITPVFASGGFSDVYDLGNNRLLHIEASTGSKNTGGLNRLKVNTVIKDGNFKIFPKIYNTEIKTGLITETFGWVIVTEMQKLDIVSWKLWRKYFQTEIKLINAIKAATEKMHLSGIIHTDISHNNVVLTNNGKIMFIDFSNSALDQDTQIEPEHTPGYVAPEWCFKNPTFKFTGPEKKTMLSYLNEWGLTESDIKPIKPMLRKKRQYSSYQYLIDNTIYGMGALAYSILTNNDPSKILTHELINPKIITMLHPIPEQRGIN